MCGQLMARTAPGVTSSRGVCESVMVVARFRNEVVGDKQPKPAMQTSDAGEKACFTIDGHHFMAIPQREWSRRKANADGDRQAAGFVQLGGVRHVLIERGAFEAESVASSSVSSVLTSRELQIAYSVADGKCDKVIAYDLGISEYTVREHLRRIFHKLNVSKRAALVAQLIMARSRRRPMP
jgi:DNA-binding CsgD family transcriptional regulator